MPQGTKLAACSDAYALAEALAQLCEDPHPEGDDWRARCPNHQGKSDTSLCITPSDDRVLVHCFGDCAPQVVVHALGLTMADLFVKRQQRIQQPRRLVKVYDYYDATGTLVHQTLRYSPKDFKQRRPDPVTPGKWIWDIKNIEPVLYNLPAVLRAVEDNRIVFIVEGEKDADFLIQKGYVATCNPMGAGKGKWRPSYSAALRGAHVVLVPDFDAVGANHMNTIGQALLGLAADIKIVNVFHTTESGSDICDWFADGGTREDFELLVSTAHDYEVDVSQPVTPPLGFPMNGIHPQTSGASLSIDIPKGAMVPTGRRIQQDRHLLPQVVAQAQDALLHMPGAPLVFQRARRLVAIAPAERVAKGIARSQGTPIISALTGPRLRALLAQAAGWVTPYGTKSDKLKEDMPQPWVVETLLDQEDWEFPPLTGLLNSPTMRPDGSLILTQGYDASTGLWIAWTEPAFPAIPEQPTRQDAQQALHALAEPFQDFPFAAPHYHSAAIAAVLTLIARYAMHSVPLFAIRATTRGSGKTLLADCIAMIATGRMASKMPQVKEEEEERKRLLALALDGDPLVVIDNVTGALGNAALDLAVTSQLFKDRLLGKNATKEAPLHTVFFATGNNMFFKGDMARRALPIDLAPDIENPEARGNFVHPRLLEWVQRERPRLVSAALLVLRAYLIAGKPPQPIDPYGSFETWSDLVRSALVWAGEPDPCLGREGLEAASDETFEAHAELLNVWFECYKSAPTNLASIVADIQHNTGTTYSGEEAILRKEDIQRWDRFREALGFFDTRFDGQRLHSKALGHSLRRLCGRVIDGKRLKKLDERSKYGTQWSVEEVKPIPF